MKIQYRKRVTSPREAVGRENEIRDVPKVLAQRLCDEGYAFAVKAPKKPKPKKKVAENEPKRTDTGEG